jgi:hypothetical protein
MEQVLVSISFWPPMEKLIAAFVVGQFVLAVIYLTTDFVRSVYSDTLEAIVTIVRGYPSVQVNVDPVKPRLHDCPE